METMDPTTPTPDAQPEPATTEPVVRTVNLLDLEQDPNNANMGTERGQQALAYSVRQFGAGAAPVIDRRGRLLVGNKRTKKFIEAGMTEAIVIETDGSRPIVIQRTDLDATDDAARATEFAIADNRTSELDLNWNAEQLRKDLAAGAQLGLFEDNELEAILGAPETALTGGTEGEAGPVGSTAGAAQPAASQVKMVQLYLTTETFAPFRQKVEELAAAFQLHNTTDVIEWALNYAHAAWKQETQAQATEPAATEAVVETTEPVPAETDARVPTE